MSERTSWTTGSFSTFAEAQRPEDAVAGLVLVCSRVHEALPSVVPLEKASLTVGRDPTCDLTIPESAVSRLHAKLERVRGGGYVITDQGATNGTLVNARRITSHLLCDQDVVRVGDTVFRFTPNHAYRYAAYRIDGEKNLANCPPHGIVDPLLTGGMQVDLVLDRIARVARTNLTAVVHGESGTGKELVARELHRWSGRRGAFVAINCGALPPTLVESELFGHKRGAFTGAHEDKVGLVKSAHGGTLFLDEIGDMPLDAQSRLLRVLQEREVTPLGATQPVRVDVRVVAATHRDLPALVASGRFRGDLLARLGEVVITLPPLRSRREDLNLLVRAFLAREGHARKQVSIGYMLALAHYDFPYNVRELWSAVRLSVAMAGPNALEVSHLPTTIQGALDGPRGRTVDEAPAPAGEPRASADVAPTEAALRDLLAHHRGNVAAVGRQLGKERMQVHRWMKRYGIIPDDYRD